MRFNKKLVLKRETLRLLQSQNLDQINGGWTDGCWRVGVSLISPVACLVPIVISLVVSQCPGGGSPPQPPVNNEDNNYIVDKDNPQH